MTKSALNGTAKPQKIDSNDFPGKAGDGALKADTLRLLEETKRTAALEAAAAPPQDEFIGQDETFATGATAAEETAEVCPGWPAIVDAALCLETPAERPLELIEHIAFAGAKISLSGTSKGHKTFIQIDLAVSVATGTRWMGHQTRYGRVLYINLELSPYSFEQRLAAICRKKNVRLEPGALQVLHLRGQHATIEDLQKYLRRHIGDQGNALIIVDPLYKILGGRNENAASEMGDLLNRLEAIAHHAGAAIIVAHHFAKGSAAGKSQLDRSSGSGVVARDGDVIITLTEHEEDECCTLEITVRDFPPVPPSVVKWVFPCFEPTKDLDPCKLKMRQNQAAPVTQADILAVVTTTPQTKDAIVKAARDATGRGEKAVEDAFKKTVSLLKCEALKRPGTNPLKRYFKVETFATVETCATPAEVSCGDQ